jgi:hypothetical protein
LRTTALTSKVDWGEFHNCQSETDRIGDRDTPNSNAGLQGFEFQSIENAILERLQMIL